MPSRHDAVLSTARTLPVSEVPYFYHETFGLRDPNHSSTPEILLLCFKLLGTISCDDHIAKQCATNACCGSVRLTNYV
jgi:hypothetical protein